MPVEEADDSSICEVRYLTDDRDEEVRHELVIMRGGNGDLYVSVVPEGKKAFEGVRICLSGGARASVPGLAMAIAKAFEAIATAPSFLEGVTKKK